MPSDGNDFEGDLWNDGDGDGVGATMSDDFESDDSEGDDFESDDDFDSESTIAGVDTS